MAALTCNALEAAVSILHTLLCIILLSITIYAFVKFTKAISDGSETGVHIGKAAGFIMIICTFLAIVSRTIYMFNLDDCYGMAVSEWILTIFYNAYIGFFGIQSIALSVTFYTKLVAVFASTPYRISKGTRACFICIYIAFPVLVVTGLLLAFLGISRAILSLMTVIGIAWLLLLMIALLSIFVYKLLIVHRDCANQQGDESFINSITKATLLSSISIVATFADIIGSSMHYYVYPSHLWLVIPIFDLFTNFLCVMMCFKSFTNNYKTLCACCDTRCRKTLRYMFSASLNESQMAESVKEMTKIVSIESVNETVTETVTGTV